MKHPHHALARASRALAPGTLFVCALLAACGGGEGPTDPDLTPDNVVASVTISGDSTVGLGKNLGLTAVAKNAAGATVSASVTWSSDAPSVVSVSGAGVVTGLTAGLATITATAGGVSDTHGVTAGVNDLNSIVDSVRQAHGLPAMVGAIVTRAAGITGRGVAGNRRAAGPAATLEDKWHIGSNLKGITAMLAAIAVDRGDITWGTTVETMFPELGVAILPAYLSVTLADLLSMQGGIRNDPPPGTYAGATPREQRESAAAWGLAATPIGPRGSFYYSNISYVIAGAMIERAMGGTYEALILSEIGTLAGATQLGFGPQAGAGANDQPVAHSWDGTAWVACEACDNPPGISAAGAAHLSIADWAGIMREFMRADAGTSTMVAQTPARAVFTGAIAMPGSNDLYGLGWVMTTRAWGGRTANHAGSNTVNHSIAWVGLDTGIAFLAATNAADLASGRTATALNGLITRLLQYHQTGQ